MLRWSLRSSGVARRLSDRQPRRARSIFARGCRDVATWRRDASPQRCTRRFIFCCRLRRGVGDRATRPAAGLTFDAVEGALLAVADRFFFWRRGIAAALDIFSSIAIATTVATPFANLRRSFAVCIVLIGLLFAPGYGVELTVRTQAPDRRLVAAWFFDAKTTVHGSCPFVPWLIYPLLGLALCRQYRGEAVMNAGSREDWLVSAALVVFVVSLRLRRRAMEFLRWGTMNGAYSPHCRSAFFRLARSLRLRIGVARLRGRCAALRRLRSYPCTTRCSMPASPCCLGRSRRCPLPLWCWSSSWPRSGPPTGSPARLQVRWQAHTVAPCSPRFC